MKCPKCGYLGFETGDKCRNCGYDFSLIAEPAAPPPAADTAIRPEAGPSAPAAGEPWLERFDRTLDDASRPADHLQGVRERPVDPAPLDEQALPLFLPEEPDEYPLMAIPTPRPPLAVRRSTEAPRLHVVPRVTPPTPSPALDFLEEPVAAPAERRAVEPSPVSVAPAKASASVAGRRLVAGLVDLAILVSVDALVFYFTVRMAGLRPGELALLPLAPMATFIGLLKLSYFTAFTAVGGQTIGKMALRIRVVGDDGAIDGPLALRRTLLATISLLALGLGFVPIFFGDRRALHDRLSGTRVVGSTSG